MGDRSSGDAVTSKKPLGKARLVLDRGLWKICRITACETGTIFYEPMSTIP